MRKRLILRALDSNNPDIVTAAILGVNQHGIQEAWPQLVRLLDAPSTSVRSDALAALDALRRSKELEAEIRQIGPAGPESAVSKAIDLARSEDPTRRRGAALALGALGSRTAVATLLELLDDPDDSVRGAALQALNRLGGTSE